MNHKCEWCDAQQIEQFLADQLTDQDLHALEDHLGECPSCREALENRAAERSWWREARGFLAASNRCVEQSANQRNDSDGTDVLAVMRNHLGASDDPRMLGRLGGYDIVGIVGAGGMGIVLKGWEGPLNRYVAIKVLHPRLALSQVARKRFAREARAAASVIHENVVAIHAVAEANGLPFLVMPYLTGPSLAKRLQREGALTVVAVLRIGMQIASALSAAHAQGLIHRDVKPANILLGEGTERVTLTDFGLARAVDDVCLTGSGETIGTPQFMSPEQAVGAPVDQRSDLFSLGSVLYALCTGVAPFQASTTLGVLKRVTDEQPKPIRDINPDIPDWLDAIVARLHAKAPEKRFTSAGEVCGLFESWLAHLQQPATIAPPRVHDLDNPDRLAPRLIALRNSLCVATNRLWLAALVVLAAVGIMTPLLLLQLATAERETGASNDKPTTEIIDPSMLRLELKDGLDQKVPLSLFGPEVRSSVTFDGVGLRIILPAQRQSYYSVGASADARLSGDFEVTLEHQLLDVAKPGPKNGAGNVLLIRFGAAAAFGVSVTRMEKATGSTFGANYFSREDDGVEKFRGLINTQANQPGGKLRLKRSGKTVLFQVADGNEELRSIHQLDLDQQDVTVIRAQSTTGNAPVALESRFLSLTLQADKIGGQVLVAGGSEGVRALLLTAVLAGLTVTLAGVAMGYWWFVRRDWRTRSVKSE